jgi:glycosyltransferase involved in cell wall biosynthesis
MTAWCRAIPNPARYMQSSKKFGRDETWSVSAVIACYKDGQAIPFMHKRLTAVFDKLNVEYEIIFVNDNSPDDSEEVVRAISARDHHVIGISHSRNFGSQSAFRSGMEIATKNACVLLDGDLQDPPELIEQFVEQWRAGFDVVYGRRVKREAPWYMGDRLQVVLPRVPAVFVRVCAARRRGFLVDGPPRGAHADDLPRAGPVHAGPARIRRLQADRRGLCAA